MDYEAIVIGAGPAGLATSYALSRARISHVVLERGAQVGHNWANFYSSLVLHTGRHLSSLPGLPFPRGTPLFPSRRDMVDYLQRYAGTFALPVETGIDVRTVTRDESGWRVDGRRALTIVIATGIASNPFVPEIANLAAFRGRVRHSGEYREPEPFKGRRTLVVGAGNSGGEIAAELGRAGVDVIISARSPLRAVPRVLAGVPIQYFAAVLAPLLTRRPCARAPLVGSHLAAGLKSGVVRLAGVIEEFTAGGARFAGGTEHAVDEVILATGYRAAVGVLGNLVQLDDCGFARRRDRVVSVDQPDLYIVGHNYDSRGGLLNIARDSRLAAAHISARLRERSRRSTGTPRQPSGTPSESCRPASADQAGAPSR